MSQIEKNKKKIFSERLNEIIRTWEKTNEKRLFDDDLAGKIPVSRETVNRWRHGRACPLDDDLTMKNLCKFFNVSRWYFYGEEGLTLVNEDICEDLEEKCEKIADKYGLSRHFVRFVKENPAHSSAVISASIVDAYIQSFSPDVPDMGHDFQFISASGTKCYPPDDVILMLCLVQRDLSEYISFLIEKYSRVIHDAYHEASCGPIFECENGAFKENGERFVSAGTRFALELTGKGSISPDESLLIDAFRRCGGEEQKELIKEAAHLMHKSRKKK